MYTHSGAVPRERSSRQIIRRLRSDGFELVKITGSHHKFKKNGRIVTVPHPKKDLPIGTVRAICKQAGWID
ncbi:type II toxin-antitoxin system HicA family toxin [Hoeflea sp. YIM 152468]|uniref:type II toxin-antitoxin system HicA family toxin n=1 Tax=Hoeflea sp. YIM 152468 TaxID=3031759 RepID=UPI0023DC2F6C|nr:type II toxin-antitoxin system HicA family toxin [Hoeflea sp. YIM 152468]MDF1607553.1 type II toxin-antitoxin system HicA family toxin [Hoeflea sp. YIM 152468]